MAPTFGCLLLVSKRSIWIECFSKVEQLMGKYQIALGKRIIAQNLRYEIALSPMNNELQKAKLTLMMDGGWDQRASGKGIQQCLWPSCVPWGRTNKVCALVYYSKPIQSARKGNHIPWTDVQILISMLSRRRRRRI
jgi:hypothetical protein